MKIPVIGIPARQAINPVTQAPMEGITHTYLQALIEAGAAPVIIPRNLSTGAWEAIFDSVAALLFPGGSDVSPVRYGETTRPAVSGVSEAQDELELTLMGWAIERNKPFLGICRGMQVLNVALGGSLYQDIASQRPASLRHNAPGALPRNQLTHGVTVEPGSKLADCLGQTEIAVNSLHHQAVREPAPRLRVVALAEDQVIEGVELPQHPFGLGVQWHPEELLDHAEMRCLFESLVAAAR